MVLHAPSHESKGKPSCHGEFAVSLHHHLHQLVSHAPSRVVRDPQMAVQESEHAVAVVGDDLRDRKRLGHRVRGARTVVDRELNAAHTNQRQDAIRLVGNSPGDVEGFGDRTGRARNVTGLALRAGDRVQGIRPLLALGDRPRRAERFPELSFPCLEPDDVRERTVMAESIFDPFDGRQSAGTVAGRGLGPRESIPRA